MSDRPTYCWDASVFLGWLGEEESAPLADMDLVRGEIDSGEAFLLVPATVIAEVLEAKNTPEQMEKFRNFLKRSNVVVADITQTIAEKTAQVRSRALGLKPQVKLGTPDATYIATAIVFKADVFHTLEKSQLPQLSGIAVVDGLKISAPRPLKGTTSFLNPSEPPPSAPPRPAAS
jgi:predicted nucleic acid-binding protein